MIWRWWVFLFVVLLSPKVQSAADPESTAILKLTNACEKASYGHLLQHQDSLIKEFGTSNLCGPASIINVLQKLKRAAGVSVNPDKSRGSLNKNLIELVNVSMPAMGIKIRPSGIHAYDVFKIIKSELRKNQISARTYFYDLEYGQTKDGASEGVLEDLTPKILSFANKPEQAIVLEIAGWPKDSPSQKPYSEKYGHLAVLGTYDEETGLGILVTSDRYGPREVVKLVPAFQSDWNRATFQVLYPRSKDTWNYYIKGAIRIEVTGKHARLKSRVVKQK